MPRRLSLSQLSRFSCAGIYKKFRARFRICAQPPRQYFTSLSAPCIDFPPPKRHFVTFQPRKQNFVWFNQFILGANYFCVCGNEAARRIAPLLWETGIKYTMRRATNRLPLFSFTRAAFRGKGVRHRCARASGRSLALSPTFRQGVCNIQTRRSVSSAHPLPRCVKNS